MSSEYDQSGKYFSHVISKEPIKVIIQTRTSRIEGEVYKKFDERMLDAMISGPPFIAVTNATVYDLSGRFDKAVESSFLAINKEAIEWIVPQEELS